MKKHPIFGLFPLAVSIATLFWQDIFRFDKSANIHGNAPSITTICYWSFTTDRILRWIFFSIDTKRTVCRQPGTKALRLPLWFNGIPGRATAHWRGIQDISVSGFKIIVRFTAKRLVPDWEPFSICKDCLQEIMPFLPGWQGIRRGPKTVMAENNNGSRPAFHGTNDGTVPFYRRLSVWFAHPSYVRGSQQLNEQLDHWNIYHEFYPKTTNIGAPKITGPTNWGDIINKAKVFMAARRWSPQCGPLPLSLTSSPAGSAMKMVDLFWNTASEISSIKKIVERSGDGMNFWTAGNNCPKEIWTAEPRIYSHRSVSLFGYSYYRLKMQDADGSFSSSETIRD